MASSHGANLTCELAEFVLEARQLGISRLSHSAQLRAGFSLGAAKSEKVRALKSAHQKPQRSRQDEHEKRSTVHGGQPQVPGSDTPDARPTATAHPASALAQEADYAFRYAAISLQLHQREGEIAAAESHTAMAAFANS